MFFFVVAQPFLVSAEKSGHAELKKLGELDGDPINAIREDGDEFGMPDLE